MKKVLVLLAMVLGTTNMYAQDYDLQGLAKACKECSTLSSFHDGLAAICKDGKWGYMDKVGKIVIPPSYSSARDFHEGLAAVSKDGRYGYIDKDGNVILQFRYLEALDFIDGYANVTEGEDSTYSSIIDKMGIPIPCKINSGEVLSEGLIRVLSYDTEKYGYFDTQGQKVIPFIFNFASDFKEGVAKVARNDKFGFIDKKGKVVIPFEYNEYSLGSNCSDGLISFQKTIGSEYFYGFINKQGHVVIPCELDNVSDFHEGLAWVQWASWRGFIDVNGNKKLGCKYYCKEGFKEGMAVITDESKFSYVNRTGQIIAPFSFDEANDFSEGLALVKKGDKWGYIDKQGNTTFNLSTNATNNNVQNTNTEIIDVTETMPSFVGGKDQLNKWLAANFHYPELALENGIKGTVVASVAIECDGSIGEVTIKKSVDPLLDKETIRLFKSMPRWNPGTQNGKPVRVVYDMPLNFNF